MTDPKKPEELSNSALDDISGGPNRRAHDHIGNFNFKGEANPGDPAAPGLGPTPKKSAPITAPGSKGIITSGGGGTGSI